jgi:CHASE2 domain-containing sensor protein
MDGVLGFFVFIELLAIAATGVSWFALCSSIRGQRKGKDADQGMQALWGICSIVAPIYLAGWTLMLMDIMR